MTKQDAERLHQLIARHAHYTNSARAKTILDNWADYLPKFKKVMPVEYRQALAEMAKHQAADPHGPRGDRDRPQGGQGLAGIRGARFNDRAPRRAQGGRARAMKIFGDLGSGNCLKVKYTADHLGLPYTWVPIDIMKGETQDARVPGALPHGPHPGGGARRRPPPRRVRTPSSAIWRAAARCCRTTPSPRPRSTSCCSGSSTATSPTSPPRAITSSI